MTVQHRNQTFNQRGKLIAEEVIEVEDDPPTADDRIAALEAEVRGMKERAAAVSTTNADAVKVRDAITGPPATR